MLYRSLKCLCLLLFIALSCEAYSQNTIRLYKADNMFRNKLLQVGDNISLSLKNRKRSLSGSIDQVDSASFVLRTREDSLVTVYPDSLRWIEAGKNTWGTTILGSLGTSLVGAGGMYFAYGMINGLLSGYDLMVILPGRIITGAVLSASGFVVMGIHYLIKAKRCKMPKWRIRINDFTTLGHS